MSPSVPAVEVPATTPISVRLERLRAGRTDETLFLVPGMAGDPDELTTLAAALTGPQEICAVAPALADPRHHTVLTMEAIAEHLVTKIRQVQPSGPYRLGGYSFGGVLALEMAQQLRAAGEVVQPLILIEAIYDERHWPRGIWVRALARRTGRQLLHIARLRPREAVAELRLRGGRLIQRVVRRSNTEAPDPLRLPAVDDGTFWDCASAALAGYRPRRYDGRVTLIASLVDRHFGCDTAGLWAGYATHLDVHGVAGDHVTAMQEPTGAAAIARVIDHRLAMAREGWTGVRPTPGFERPMVLTTMRWFSAARLAHALLEAGFSVSTCRPRGHALELVDGLTLDCRLSRLRQVRSLATAIRRASPDIILPGDERALVLLRRLHARIRDADAPLAAVIAHSLGNVEDWSSIVSRTALADAAHALNIRVPVTEVVDGLDALDNWMSRQNLPVVLKTDGSWGGRGVIIVGEASRASTAWRTLSSPPALPRALKRLLVNREAGALEAWLRHTQPVVNAQQFVEGTEAIVTAACVNGETLALVCLDVAEKLYAEGPATVVRVVDSPAMADAARLLVRRFGLSGFCGFDFLISRTGEAHLVELNPRLTPTAHLLVEGDHERSRTIALFPAESDTVPPDVLDVPVRAPSLVKLGERIAARQHRPIARLAGRLRQKRTT